MIPKWISTSQNRRQRALDQNPDNILIAYSYEYFSKEANKNLTALKYSTTFKTYDQLLNYLQTLNDIQKSPFLTHTKLGEKDRLKIDVDLKFKEHDIKLFLIKDFPSKIQLFIKDLKSFFEIPENVKHHISDRSRPKDDFYKCSNHIVFDAYFESSSIQKTAMFDFLKSFPKWKDYIDMAVYTEVQPWNETKRKIITESNLADLIPSYIQEHHFKINKIYKPFNKIEKTEENKRIPTYNNKRNLLISFSDTSFNQKKLKTLWKVLNELDEKCYSEWMIWRNIGWSLRSIENSKEVFSLWVKFSQKWKQYKGDYDPSKIWNDYNQNKTGTNGKGLSLGYIIDQHRKSNTKSRINYNDLIPPKHLDILEGVEDLGMKIKKFSSDYLTNTNGDIDQSIISLDQFKNKVVAIRSKTGTGKTTLLKSCCDEYRKEGYEVLSIVSRQSMAYLHSDKLELKNYLDNYMPSDYSLDFVYCLNSLMKLNLEDDHPNFILILDEFSSFINYILNDISEFQNQRITILSKFVKVFQKAKIVICADSDMSKYTLEFLKVFSNKPIDLYINTKQYKNQKDVVVYSNENILKEQVKNSIINDEPFFCGSDSVKQVSLFYEELKEELSDTYPDLVKKMLIYSQVDGDKEDFKITDDWKDKFVFASPTILYGLDCNYKAKVFGFYYGNSIDASGITQQLARIRQPELISIYFKQKSRTRKYYSIDSCRNDYYCYANNKIEEAYNNLRINYEYNKDILMDLYFHVLDILRSKGHKIVFNNSKKLKSSVPEIDKTKLELSFAGLESYDDLKLDNEDIKKTFMERIITIGMKDFNDDEEKKKFLEIITSNRKYNQFLAFKSLKKDSLEALESISNLKRDFDIEITKSEINKIILVKKLSRELDLSEKDIFSIDLSSHKNDDELIMTVTDPLMKSIKKSFRFKTNYNSTLRAGKKLLMNMLRSIVPDLIESKHIKVDQKQYRFKSFIQSELKFWNRVL